MKKLTIRTILQRLTVEDLFNGRSIQQSKELLDAYLTQYESKYDRICIDTEYHYESIDIILVGYRDETDAEFNVRLEKAKILKVKKDISLVKEKERLLKKLATINKELEVK